MPELMTKQDAIEYLLYMKHNVQAKSPMDIALDTAIEALKQPTIESDIDHAAILRLCNAIEDLAADIGNHTMMDVVYAEARMIFDKAKEIGKELTGDAGTD